MVHCIYTTHQGTDSKYYGTYVFHGYTTDTGGLLPLLPWELQYLATFSLVSSSWSCQRGILATCSAVVHMIPIFLSESPLEEKTLPTTSLFKIQILKYRSETLQIITVSLFTCIYCGINVKIPINQHSCTTFNAFLAIYVVYHGLWDVPIRRKSMVMDFMLILSNHVLSGWANSAKYELTITGRLPDQSPGTFLISYPLLLRMDSLVGNTASGW